jgi:hypothetical protein
MESRAVKIEAKNKFMIENKQFFEANSLAQPDRDPFILNILASAGSKTKPWSAGVDTDSNHETRIQIYYDSIQQKDLHALLDYFNLHGDSNIVLVPHKSAILVDADVLYKIFKEYKAEQSKKISNAGLFKGDASARQQNGVSSTTERLQP